jgi:GntR family transcriptional regulator/MocR family aminotransferase
MSKKEAFQDLPLMPPSGAKELWRWLRDELRTAILTGRLKRGTRMPSSRGLARQYQCSRGTVVSAFEHLQAEGYIESRRGQGTFVAFELPDDSFSARRPDTYIPRRSSHADLSKRGRLAVDNVIVPPASRSLGKAFRAYEPAIDLFPVDLWSRISGRVARRAPLSIYGQGDARGFAPLRKAIAEYVGSTRGVRCDADQVLVTSGAQQALDLVARLLLDPGEGVLMEDPGYPGAAFALRAAGAQILPVPVDGEGLNIEWAQRKRRKAKLAYVTPANQFPTGVTMSAPRRTQLLDWAFTESAWIVEDEYDAEYRYFGPPVPALQSLDETGSVIYIGTFTKMLFNALRLGFVVLPGRLVDAFAAARAVTDRHPPTIQQAILAEFILEGHFAHHVRRMRQIYAERISVLVEAGKRKLRGHIDVAVAVSGMKTIGWLNNGDKDSVVAERARSKGLELAPLSQFAVQHVQPNGLLLGFAGSPPAELRRGVDVLASVLR